MSHLTRSTTLSRPLFVRAIALFALPVSLWAIAACGGGSSSEGPTAEPTPRATATRAATVTQGPTDTPQPTPTPYDGQVSAIKIPKFGVESNMEVIGFVPGTNRLATPSNPLNTGWYDMYGKPGFGRNAVFSAHYNYLVGGSFVDAPFHRLSELELGDEIQLVMDDGTTYRYLVLSNQRYTVDTIPLGEIIDAVNRPPTQEWITLITCGGETTALDDRGVGSFLERDVVVAVKIGG